MKQDVSKILQRQLLLMGYKSDNTLSENIERIKSKSFLTEQGSMDMRDDYYGSEEYIEKHDTEMSNKIARTYPNYCWNNGEGTVVPGENEHGLSGADAIPVGDNGEMFCAYRGVGNKLLFLPVNTTDIKFNEGSIEEANRYLEIRMSDESADPISKDDEGLKRAFVEFITSNFIAGSVRKFTAGGITFTTWNQRIPQSSVNPKMSFNFYGYCPTGGGSECYSNPVWKDPRNSYQKFVDEWGLWIQIGAAVATAILGAVTGGATWVLTAEILVEMGLGIWVAQREFERGDNIAATASIIFGLLPMLKLTKWFPGVSDDVFKSLSKSFAESGLQATDDVADYVLFYNKLDDEQRMLLSKFLKQDDLNRNRMFEEIAKQLGEMSAGKIDDGLKAMIKANPKILKDISFFNRLWVRELGANAGVIVVTTALELCCSKMLNDETKMKFSKVYSVIPDSTKKLFTYNIVNNPEQAEAIIDSMSQKTFEDNFDVESGIESIADWARKNVKESTESAGGEFIDINDTESDTSQDKPVKGEPKITTQSQIDSLKNEGWMTMNEFINSGIEYDDISDPVSHIVNGNEVWLVKKK